MAYLEEFIDGESLIKYTAKVNSVVVLDVWLFNVFILSKNGVENVDISANKKHFQKKKYVKNKTKINNILRKILDKKSFEA